MPRRGRARCSCRQGGRRARLDALRLGLGLEDLLRERGAVHFVGPLGLVGLIDDIDFMQAEGYDKAKDIGVFMRGVSGEQEQG